jgi:hypothetical protein
MRTLPGLFIFCLLVGSVSAQVGPPNAAGVAVGHVHLLVRNVEGHRKLWKLIGAEDVRSGALGMLKFPGLVVLLRQGDPTGGSEGSSLDHFGLMVKDLAGIRSRLEAQRVKFETPYREVPAIGLKLAFLTDPVGTRIELTEGLAGL